MPIAELFAELDRAVAQAELPEDYRPLVLREVRSQLERGEPADPSKAVRDLRRPRCRCDPPSSGNWCPRCRVATRIPPEALTLTPPEKRPGRKPFWLPADL